MNYCHHSHQILVRRESRYSRPLCFENLFSVSQFTRNHVHRIVNFLDVQPGQVQNQILSGIPDLRGNFDILTVAPFLQHDMFNKALSTREDFRAYGFQSYGAPAEDIWGRRRYKMNYGNVIRDLFRCQSPPLEEARRWKLYRFRVPHVANKALYFLVYTKPPIQHPDVAPIGIIQDEYIHMPYENNNAAANEAVNQAVNQANGENINLADGQDNNNVGEGQDNNNVGDGQDNVDGANHDDLEDTDNYQLRGAGRGVNGGRGRGFDGSSRWRILARKMLHHSPKSATVTDLQANKKVKGDLAAKQRSSAKGTDHATSPRSSYRKLRTLESVLCKQMSSLSGNKGLNKGVNGAHQAPARDFPIFSPQHSDDELNGSCNMNRSPDEPSAVSQQKVASQREEMDKPEKDQNGGTDVLRSKLWEILGKASPAYNEVKSETPEVGKTNFKLSQDKGSNNDPLVKPRHISDSIETDSESPENATRRPVTRSLLQRRVGAKGVQKRTKAGANLGGKSAEDFHPSPEAETGATREMFHGLSKNGDEQERPSKVAREKSVEPENEFQSPTFGYKAAISSPSPCSSPEASPLHPRNISPAFDETETPIFSFGTKKTSLGTKGQASDTEKRLPDFLEKKGDYCFEGDSSAEPNEDLVLSDPWSDEKDTGPKPGFSSAKRNSYLKGKGRVVLSPTSSVSKGIHKTDSFQQLSELDEDEGLGRAISLFAVALQNFEKKLKSAAKKKCSEIIASVSEEIHQELENVKSHIITEAGMMSNLAKAKRKHAEDFKSTIEGLEANPAELKRAIKKQRISQQELIAYFEGGIETKLDNAAKRINSVNESARGKMLQLKMIVAECLKDDMCYD